MYQIKKKKQNRRRKENFVSITTSGESSYHLKGTFSQLLLKCFLGFSLPCWNFLFFVLWNATLAFLVLFWTFLLVLYLWLSLLYIEYLKCRYFPRTAHVAPFFSSSVWFSCIIPRYSFMPSTCISSSDLRFWLCVSHYCYCQLLPALPPSRRNALLAPCGLVPFFFF